MKKLKSKIIMRMIIIILLIISLIKLFNWVQYGTPWELNEVESITRNYLETQHIDKMNIDKSERYRRGKRYTIYASSQEKPHIQFEVIIDLDLNEIYDDYLKNIISDDLSSELQTILDSKYYKNAGFFLNIDYDALILYNKNISFNDSDEIKEIIAKNNNQYEYDVYSWEIINYKNIDETAQKIQDVLEEMKKKQLYPHTISFRFYGDNDTRIGIEITSDMYNSDIDDSTIKKILIP